MIINKYRKMSNTVKASMWYAVGNFFQKGLSMLLLPIYTRVMTSAEYGQYSLYQSWFSIISIFATLNLSYYVFNNGMIKYPYHRNEFISSLWGLSSLTTLIIGALGLIFKEQWIAMTGLSEKFWILIIVESLVTPAYLYWSAKERFDYKYKGILLVTIITSVMIPIVSLILMKQITAHGLAAVVGRVAVIVIVYIFPLGFILSHSRQIVNIDYWKYALNFNLPLIPHFLSAIVLAQADRIMIGKMFGESEVGIYSIAYSISFAISILNSSILNTFVPWTYRKMQKKNYEDINRNSIKLLIMIASIGFGVMLLAPEIICVVAPPEYHNAIYAMPPIICSVYFMFLFNLFANIEYYYEKTKFVMIASCMSAFLNIILNYIVMPRYGYLAAGYTTLVCYIVYSLNHYLFMEYICKKQKISIYNKYSILKISGIVLVLMFVSVILYNVMLLRYFFLVVGSVIIFKEFLPNYKKHI